MENISFFHHNSLFVLTITKTKKNPKITLLFYQLDEIHYQKNTFEVDGRKKTSGRQIVKQKINIIISSLRWESKKKLNLDLVAKSHSSL